jgi:hypothetical protein
MGIPVVCRVAAVTTAVSATYARTHSDRRTITVADDDKIPNPDVLENTF